MKDEAPDELDQGHTASKWWSFPRAQEITFQLDLLTLTLYQGHPIEGSAVMNVCYKISG